VVYEEGILVLWRLLPHGIFELPALFLSAGLGLRLGTFIFRKNKLKSLKNYLFESLRVFLFIIFPFLLIAAIIEGILISFFG
jgi:stage II sporulation protein M